MKPRIEDWIYIHSGTEVHLPGYSFMLAVAIAAGCWMFLRLIRNRSLDERIAFTFLCLAVPLVLVGGKLGYLAQYPDSWERGSDFWLGNGTSLYGGLIAVLASILITTWNSRNSLFHYLDALAVSLSLGLVFGRLGCFLGGCNAGSITQLPWGVSFPRETPTFKRQLAQGLLTENHYLSLPVHPTQLYESGMALMLFVLGFWLYRMRLPEGRVFGILLGGYAIFRFLEEFIRADAGGIHPFGLTFAQGISVCLAALAAIFLLIRRSSLLR